MYVSGVARSFGFKEMLLDIAHFTGACKLEFVSYDPSKNDYHHRQEPRVRCLVDVSEFEENGLETIRKEICRPSEALGISSSSRDSHGDEFHLPQIDFRCPVTYEDETGVKSFLEEIDQTCGYLVDSGRSYHYYGKMALGAKQWETFMDLLSDEDAYLVDTTFHEIMLDLGYSVLRLSDHAGTNKPVPKIIAKIGRPDNNFELPFEGESYLIGADFEPF